MEEQPVWFGCSRERGRTVLREKGGEGGKEDWDSSRGRAESFARSLGQSLHTGMNKHGFMKLSSN